MVRYRRNYLAGGTYFFTIAVADRKSNLLVDHIDTLRAAVRQARRSHPFEIDAAVVLPDHLHLVLTLPSADADFSNRLSLIKRKFTDSVAKLGVTVPRRANNEPALWQRRFWEHTVRDEVDFERYVDYIHFNPVKHHLVSRVRDWPYSSFHRYVRLGTLPVDWAGEVAKNDNGGFGEREG